MSINKVCLSGNLTYDPELKATQSGTSILRFGMAVNDRRKNQQTGNYEDYPNFIDLVIFGARADALSRILVKGMKVAVEGKLSYSSWQDQTTGQKRSKLEVVVDELDIMSQRNGNQQQPQQQAYTAQQPPAGANLYDAPIPF